ncbi:MAG: ABC transporter ATP-binding protein [Hamadaea sp.]|nr:ABC transporter ATP-binding protein [Hamadaea sp.]
MTVIEARGLRKEFTVRKRAADGAASAGRLSRFRRTTTVVRAVDGVDLTVERGELLGYLGPNGAGKSTTLKMLTGVLTPTGGELRVCGLTPVPQRRRLAAQIGVVFGQRSALQWDLPLRESFALLRHVYRIPAGDHAATLRRCRDLLDLDAFLDTPVRQLSLGQRMRGELTAALLHDPAVIFLDEPTIGLDVLSKQAVRGFLAELGARGDTTIVLTTHDLADIERLCRRIVVIDLGRVVHDGSLTDLHARYGSRRRVTVDFADPLAPGAAPWADLPGVLLEKAAGSRLEFALESTAEVGDLLARLVAVGGLRDVTIAEPEIEDVISRLYTSPTATSTR